MKQALINGIDWYFYISNVKRILIGEIKKTKDITQAEKMIYDAHDSKLIDYDFACTLLNIADEKHPETIDCFACNWFETGNHIACKNCNLGY